MILADPDETALPVAAENSEEVKPEASKEIEDQDRRVQRRHFMQSKAIAGRIITPAVIEELRTLLGKTEEEIARLIEESEKTGQKLIVVKTAREAGNSGPFSLGRNWQGTGRWLWSPH